MATNNSSEETFELVRERPRAQQWALGIGHACYYEKLKNKLWPSLCKDGRMSYGFKHERELMSAAVGATEVETRELVAKIEASRSKIFAKLSAAFDAVAA